MRLTKTLGLCLMIASAISGLAATVASAAPEFLHSAKEVVKKGFTVKSKIGNTVIQLAGTKYKISCKSSIGSGKIKSVKEVENTVVKFKECRAKEGEEIKECEVKSTSPPGGIEEIITKTLKGRIGEVAKVEATSERGILLEPVSGTVYVTIKGSTECLPAETSEVKGSLIGEVATVKSAKFKNELIYNIKEESTQMIKKFTGDSVIHELEIFEVKTPLSSKNSIEFEEPVEVS
jgi:hypothetical protein